MGLLCRSGEQISSWRQDRDRRPGSANSDRPLAIALGVVNNAIGSNSNLMSVTQSGTPTFNYPGGQAGSIQPNAAVPYVNCFAYSNGQGSWTTICFNNNLTTAESVTLTGPGAPTGPVSETIFPQQGNVITDHNDDTFLGEGSSAPVVAAPTATSASGATYSVPPASFIALTYTAGGTLHPGASDLLSWFGHLRWNSDGDDFLSSGLNRVRWNQHDAVGSDSGDVRSRRHHLHRPDYGQQLRDSECDCHRGRKLQFCCGYGDLQHRPPRSSGSGFLACQRYLHRSANGDDQHGDAGSNDLLHHRRDDTDDLVECLQWPDHGVDPRRHWRRSRRRQVIRRVRWPRENTPSTVGARSVSFYPGTLSYLSQSSPNPSLLEPQAVVVTGSGSDLFIADEGGKEVGDTYTYNGAVWDYPQPSGTPTKIGGSTFVAPSALALDASGNLYIADYNLGAVYTASAANRSSVTQLTISRRSPLPPHSPGV
jgi:hypothetical protein